MENINKEKIVCEKCGSDKVRKIAYGLIKFKDKEDQASFEKEYYQYGCVIPHNQPTFHCDSCNKDFGDTLVGGRLPLDHKPLGMKSKNKK